MSGGEFAVLAQQRRGGQGFLLGGGGVWVAGFRKEGAMPPNEISPQKLVLTSSSQKLPSMIAHSTVQNGPYKISPP